MEDALAKAPVSVILLDKYYLEKKYTMWELRLIMELAGAGDTCAARKLYMAAVASMFWKPYNILRSILSVAMSQ